jgi:hypothetical protein
MHFFTLVLSGDEWHAVAQKAQRLWPQEHISQMEIIRRFVMTGVKTAIPNATPKRRKAAQEPGPQPH